MNKSGNFGMRVHQWVSFLPPMVRIPRAKAVFWPGCALMNYDPAIPARTLAVLRREEPMEFAAGCCGQPTRHLVPRRLTARKNRLKKAFAQAGVERVYTACPNCALQLEALGCVQAIPVWPVLARHIRPEDLHILSDSYVVHDSCPLRKEPEQQQAVRSLLEVAGVPWAEPAHTKENARCCGNHNMLRATDPAASKKIRRLRLSDFPEERCITACCAGCLDAFGSEGRRTAHILEILFGKSTSKGWGNRLKFTFRR